MNNNINNIYDINNYIDNIDNNDNGDVNNCGVNGLKVFGLFHEVLSSSNYGGFYFFLKE